jgi:hypothetical protein
MLNIVRIWILCSTWLVSAGWVLSALHQLNRTGYVVVVALAGTAGFIWWQKNHRPLREVFFRAARQLRHRWRHPLPLLFFVLAVMTLVAGALYVPSNNDSNEYRIPRVWHWLAQGQWHWIHTLDERMNIAGCGFEWLSAPLMLFTRTDRFIFLINWVSYLMLPGLIFSVFTRLGVRPRVAWWWMWLLASGWCYVMQAGSTANDSFIVIYALASVDLALRAREKKSVPDLWLSLLAAALVTGAKQTCFPLAALWLVAAWPSAKLLLARPRMTLLAGAAGLLVSGAVLIFFNLERTGSWMGMQPNSMWTHCAVNSPFWGVIGNAFCIPEQNLQPPYLPGVQAWNAAMQGFVQTPFGSHFAGFEAFGFLAQGVSGTNAGIGLWVVLLTLISIWGARHYRLAATWPPGKECDGQLRFLRLLPWGLLLVFMAKVSSYPNARQLAAYYVFLFPCFLVFPGHAGLVRRRWWQRLGLLVMLLTAGMLIVARDRPLFPAKTILVPLKEKYPGWKFLAKAWDSYACRLSLDVQRKVFHNSLPPTEAVVGYATVRGSQEAQLWLPFGSRRVQRVLPEDTSRQLQADGVHFVLVDDSGLEMLGLTIADWTKQFDGVVIDSAAFETQPGKTGWDYLVRLNPPVQK